MIKSFCVTLLALFIFSTLAANDYQDAWKAINKKNYSEAIVLLKKATKNPETALDAYCTLVYLKTYQGREVEISGLKEALTASSNKSAYLYSMWFNGALFGQYSKKAAYQLGLINTVEKDSSFNGSIRAAIHYVKGMHYIFSNDYENATSEWQKVGSLEQWQFAGPFENLSGSGFNLQYGPLKGADSAATFTGMNDVELKWFTPSEQSNEAWQFCYPIMQQSSAIVYAQTFVYVPADTAVILNAGVNGSLKVWVNDGLVISEPEERVTEMDYYKNYCRLKKGYNRILVQLGYTNNNIPNFIIRFTVDATVPLSGLTSTSVVKPYSKEENSPAVTSLPHFAETYFKAKIKNNPANLINYILLSQTYMRDSRITEARQIVEEALKLSPQNPLIKFELMQVLIKAGNRTLLLQEADWLKENDPESYINYQMKVQLLISEEKYEEAHIAIGQMGQLYGEDENILEVKATILGKLEKIDELVKLADTAHIKYPANTSFTGMMFQVKKLIEKNNNAAIEVYKNYFTTNYNYILFQALADEYKEMGHDSDYLSMIKRISTMSSQDPRLVSTISQYYYEKQDYNNALIFAQRAVSLAPYVGYYWQKIASIYEQTHNDQKAIENYRKTIYLSRTNYEARKKLTALLKKQELYKLLPETDAYALIKKSVIDAESDYTYLLDEKEAILYDEGASEEYINYVVKINTQKGIDEWKEITLDYRSTQSLLIEKCEVVKANGTKVAGERNENNVVFTGLQTGDAINVKYRLQNYAEGRLGRAFWDKFIFNSFVNSQKERYTLVVPKTLLFNYKFINSPVEPVVKEAEGYKIYTWEMNNLVALKTEPLMPPLADVAAVLHISTVKKWADIAAWYSDIVYQDTKNNYDLDALYGEIFKGAGNESSYQKAKRIYDYIVTNIRYSSVSFRQSGYVPQPVANIINTRLGDCKDLSYLFVALAAKAGIKAELVLIDTRGNGLKDMLLPSMEFNHCISLAHLDGKDYYVELTDSNLPFGSLPAEDNGALCLVIPPHGEQSTAELQPLLATNRSQDKIFRQIKLTVNGNNLNMNVGTKRYGSIVSSWRNDYSSLTKEKLKESYEQTLSNGNKNPVKLDSVSFTGLTGGGDSLISASTYTIKNEVIDAGSMKMIKVPFLDLIATLESLSADKRVYPIVYWKYENTDVYETLIEIQIPDGKKLLEYPADKNLNFKTSMYSLKFTTTGNTLKITRKVNLNRDDISPEDYTGFKDFFNAIVEAESKYIILK